MGRFPKYYKQFSSQLIFSSTGEVNFPDMMDSLLDSLAHLRIRKSGQEANVPQSGRLALSPEEGCDTSCKGVPCNQPYRSRACTDGHIHNKFRKKRVEAEKTGRGAGFRERNLSIAMRGESSSY